MQIMKNLLKEKIERGEMTVGTFLELGNGDSAEALSMSAMDYFIIDTEHGPFDVESSANAIRAAQLRGKTPLVRVKDSTRASILKMLDVGAGGLIIPQVHSIEEVKRIVEYGKYYPLGRRGVGFGRACGFGYDNFVTGDLQEYFDYCNRETLLIPQCETWECLDDIENIIRVEGIDGIFIGPYDLSVAMGIPAQFESETFKTAIERIQKAVQDAGKFIIMYSSNVEIAIQNMHKGFVQSATVGMDFNWFIEGATQITMKLKNHAG